MADTIVPYSTRPKLTVAGRRHRLIEAIVRSKTQTSARRQIGLEHRPLVTAVGVKLHQKRIPSEHRPSARGVAVRDVGRMHNRQHQPILSKPIQGRCAQSVLSYAIARRLIRENGMIRRSCTVLMGALGYLLFAICSAQADTRETARIQAALDSWLAARAGPEHVTGVAAYVSFGDVRPSVEAFAGRVGTAPNAPPVDRSTLFQMGSTSKSFAAAILLKLEAQGRLSLNDTVGGWLPEYPAWKDVTLRRLLNMTSGIPNYSETEAMSQIWINEPEHTFTAAELVNLAYPTGGPHDLPQTSGYHYSNTNYVLASMVSEKATGRPYGDVVQDWIITAYGLQATFYELGDYPAGVVRRLASGYFANPACTDYQPNCKQSWNSPLMGRDVRGMSTSWAQAAGGAIASVSDVDHWMRAVFTGQVVPARQQAEWMALVSMGTGLPIADVSPGDSHGFALGLGRGILGPFGAQWFYEGMTLGYRTLYVWFADRNLMITVQTNSQPAAGENKLNELVTAIYAVVTEPDK